MKEPPFRFDFIVPEGIDVAEEPPEGEFFTADPVPSPLLERLRGALSADPRWTVKRVTPLRPDGDPERRQHLILWTFVAEHENDELLQAARLGIAEIVTDLIPGASLIGVQQTGM